MKFTRVRKGLYKFNGIDNWNNKPIQGYIINQPIDVPLSKQWGVYIGSPNDAAYFGKTLKDCKRWLTEEVK